MSQHKGPKGPADRAKAKPQETAGIRLSPIPAHLRNLVSREQRRGLKL